MTGRHRAAEPPPAPPRWPLHVLGLTLAATGVVASFAALWVSSWDTTPTPTAAVLPTADTIEPRPHPGPVARIFATDLPVWTETDGPVIVDRQPLPSYIRPVPAAVQAPEPMAGVPEVVEPIPPVVAPVETAAASPAQPVIDLLPELLEPDPQPEEPTPTETPAEPAAEATETAEPTTTVEVEP